MYEKPLVFLVGSVNLNGSIFYQVYLIQWIAISFYKVWGCIIMMILQLYAVSTEHLYQGMRKYVVVGLMNNSWSNQGLFISFSEGTCVICLPVNKLFQIHHLSI